MRLTLSLLMLLPVLACGQIDFDGTNDIVNFGTGASHANLTNGMSVAAWVRWGGTYYDTTAYPRLVCKEGSWWLMMMENPPFSIADGINIEIKHSTTTLRSYKTGIFTSGTWAHVCMTWDGGLTASTDLLFYKDGALVTGMTQVNGVGTWASDAAIPLTTGDRAAGARPYDGELMDVAIWSTVLTPAEVAQLANPVRYLPLQIQPASLVMYAPMHDGNPGVSSDAATVRDMSANSNTGTASGGTWSAAHMSYP